MGTEGGPCREMKHCAISGAIKRLKDVPERLNELKSKILGDLLGNEPKVPGQIEKVPSLTEFLEGTPRALEELRAEMMEKIEEIEKLIF